MVAVWCICMLLKYKQPCVDLIHHCHNKATSMSSQDPVYLHGFYGETKLYNGEIEHHKCNRKASETTKSSCHNGVPWQHGSITALCWGVDDCQEHTHDNPQLTANQRATEQLS